MTDWLPHGVGKLAATMLGVGVAQRADAQRFGRGRTYQRQGAVVELVVEPGCVRAVVQGGRSEPYVVEVLSPVLGAAAAARAARLAPTSAQRYSALVPDAGDLRFSCSCPDWDDPCKHAIAAIVELGEQVARDPRVLERWRDRPPDDGRDAEIPDAEIPDADDAVGRDAARATAVAPSAGDRHRERELAAFLACPVPLGATPAISALAAPSRRWEQPWVGVLADALDVLASHERGR